MTTKKKTSQKHAFLKQFFRVLRGQRWKNTRCWYRSAKKLRQAYQNPQKVPKFQSPYQHTKRKKKYQIFNLRTSVPNEKKKYQIWYNSTNTSNPAAQGESTQQRQPPPQERTCAC